MTVPSEATNLTIRIISVSTMLIGATPRSDAVRRINDRQSSKLMSMEFDFSRAEDGKPPFIGSGPSATSFVEAVASKLLCPSQTTAVARTAARTEPTKSTTPKCLIVALTGSGFASVAPGTNPINNTQTGNAGRSQRRFTGALMSFMRPREAITNTPSDSPAIKAAPDVCHQSTRFSQKDRPFKCTQYAVTMPPNNSASDNHQTDLRTLKSGKSASSY